MDKLLNLVGGFKVYIAVALISSLLTGVTVWRLGVWHQAYKEKGQVVHTVHVIERRGKITFDVDMHFQMARLKASDATQELQAEVDKHVTPEVDRDFPVPCSFVRVFDNATHGPIPDPAGCPDATASGVTFSTVAHTEVENDGQYDLISAQLVALQDWVKQQQEVKQ